MRQAVRSLLPEFAQMTVGALVGSASNAVVRINVEDQAIALAKQDNSRKLLPRLTRGGKNRPCKRKAQNPAILRFLKLEFTTIRSLQKVAQIQRLKVR
ncbi:hypothetical protein HF325_003289 [Metschnikowia pulcherrima]|uniref:Uncharacterized protein n=1 Tax=Metschnikowia pulcherrima TaxID=27326 RepID=A0A8H7LBI8_9ASCO|nr:hypothetical protein HF325_003289 [Metschnikowia pulcherrima]